jgi:hypothetical protein
VDIIGTERDVLQTLDKMRAVICAIALILFCASMNTYIYRIDHNCLPIKEMRLWYNYTLGGFILFYIIDELFGYKNYIHENLNLICKFTSVINIILVIINHQDIMTNPLEKFLLFNGAILAVTIMILISGGRHGYFQNNND